MNGFSPIQTLDIVESHLDRLLARQREVRRWTSEALMHGPCSKHGERSLALSLAIAARTRDVLRHALKESDSFHEQLERIWKGGRYDG